MATPTLTLRALAPSAAIEAMPLSWSQSGDFAPSSRQVPVASWDLSGSVPEAGSEVVACVGAAVRQAASEREAPVMRRLQIEQSSRGLVRIHLQRNEWSPRCTMIARVTSRCDAQHGDETQITLYADAPRWRQIKLIALQLALTGLLLPFLLHLAVVVHVHGCAALVLATCVAARIGRHWQQKLRDDESLVVTTASALFAPRTLTRAMAVGPFRRTAHAVDMR